MSVNSNLRKLEAFAEEIGLTTFAKYAQTGTAYLTVHNPRGNSMVIRVADHADAYGRADYTCDGVEGSLAGAKLQLIELRETSERAVRRLRRMRRGRDRRELAERRRTWVELIVAQGDMTREEAELQADILFQK